MQKTKTKKIDRRVKYRLVIDCETCPLDKSVQKVDPTNMLAYDIGYAIVDKKGNVYKTASFIVYETFYLENDLMQSSYYADKIPQYIQDIKAGKRQVKYLHQIKNQLYKDMQEYNIQEVYAHNMYFDYTALNNTIRWVTKSRNRYFFPYDSQICDTLKMARQVIGKMKNYKYFCEKYNLFTGTTKRLSFKAENLYKYISNQPDFCESHTGLEDVLIEKDILSYCFKQKKKMNRLLFNS